MHNGSNYDYNLIIKELAKEFREQFECIGQNTEKYITFSVPIQQENANGKTMTYKISFINSVRFMENSLQILADNLAKELHKGKCKDCVFCLENRKQYCYESTYRFCDGGISKICLMLHK